MEFSKIITKNFKHIKTRKSSSSAFIFYQIQEIFHFCFIHSYFISLSFNEIFSGNLWCHLFYIHIHMHMQYVNCHTESQCHYHTWYRLDNSLVSSTYWEYWGPFLKVLWTFWDCFSFVVFALVIPSTQKAICWDLHMDFLSFSSLLGIIFSLEAFSNC